MLVLAETAADTALLTSAKRQGSSRMASMYHSTRSTVTECSAKRAVLDGLAPDGGLYVTDELGRTRIDLDRIVGQSYRENAALILKTLLDDYTDEEIAACVQAAYGDTFDAPETTPAVKVGDSFVLELFHGPTSAFKDVALQMLPQLMSRAAEQTSERIMILAATSGDTGKAALAGFASSYSIRTAKPPKSSVCRWSRKKAATLRSAPYAAISTTRKAP